MPVEFQGPALVYKKSELRPGDKSPMVFIYHSNLKDTANLQQVKLTAWLCTRRNCTIQDATWIAKHIKEGKFNEPRSA